MKLIGRQLVDEIDDLIQLRMEGVPNRDAIEQCKRNITDSLLAMDSRSGIYVDDSRDHERKSNL